MLQICAQSTAYNIEYSSADFFFLAYVVLLREFGKGKISQRIT